MRLSREKEEANEKGQMREEEAKRLKEWERQSKGVENQRRKGGAIKGRERDT